MVAVCSDTFSTIFACFSGQFLNLLSKSRSYSNDTLIEPKLPSDMKFRGGTLITNSVLLRRSADANINTQYVILHFI